MVSFPRSPNADYVTLGEISEGGGPPAMGFLPAIYTGFRNASMRYSPYGFEEELRDLEDEQIRKVKEAGYELLPLDASPEGVLLRDVTPDIFGSSGATVYKPYTDFQRASYGADAMTTDDDESRMQTTRRARANEMLGKRDEIIRKAQAARPDLGILTYDEMRAEVRRRGDELATAEASRPGFGTNLGWLLGEMAGSMDPRTNPLAVPSLAAGGFGRTTLMRIMSQFGFNSGMEATQLLTGARENMQWFGINPTLAQSAIQVGLAGALPGAMQGVGEILAGPAGRAAANRVVSKTPYQRRLDMWKVAPGFETPQYPAPIGPPGPPPVVAPPAPRIPMVRPVSEVVLDHLDLTPPERIRAAVDLDHAARGADVWSATPGELLPPTRPLKPDTSVVADYKSWQGPGMDDFTPELPQSWQSTARGHDVTIDEVARALDPEVFTKIEALGKQIRETQAAIQRAAGLAKERTGAGRFGKPTTDELVRDRIDALARTKTQAGREKIEAELAEIEAMQSAGGPVPARYNLDEQAAKLVKQQAAMREQMGMAERAMARAQGRWQLADSDRELFARWYLGLQGVPEPKRSKRVNEGIRVTLTEGPSHPKEYMEANPDIPELRDPLAADGPRNELPMDTVTRVSEARAKESAEMYDSWAKSIAKLLDDQEEAPKTTAQPGEAVEIATLPDGTPISELAAKRIEVDGEEMSVREFFSRYKDEADAIATFTSCRVASGWSSGA